MYNISLLALRRLRSEDEEENEEFEGAVVPGGAFTASDNINNHHQEKAKLRITPALHLYPSLHFQPLSQ